MARKRYKPEEIVSMLRQAEVLHGQGMSMAKAAPLPETAPHATLHAKLGDVRAPVWSIGIAWRSNRPSLGSSTACAMLGNDRPRTSGYASGSSSAPSNGTKAGTTIRVSSSRSSRCSGRNRRWRRARRPRHGRRASTSRFTERCRGRTAPSTSITSSPSPAPSASMPSGLRAIWKIPPWMRRSSGMPSSPMLSASGERRPSLSAMA